MSEQGDSLEPQSKRQKRGDGDEEVAAPEIIAFGGPMYDEATARKILQEVVLISAEYTEDDVQVVGFDPDDAALDDTYDSDSGWITPMLYFAREGNVKMCGYLVSRGVSTTRGTSKGVSKTFFPMYSAAQNGHLDVCKFLYENGAQNDVRRLYYNYTPFKVAAAYGHTQVIQWLVLHGALCADNNSEAIEGGRVNVLYRHPTIPAVARSCSALIAWAEEVTQSHSALITYLCGTLPPTSSRPVQISPRRQRFLQCLSGHPGVRKHIADFVGLEVTKGKHLRILRSVMEVLPAYHGTYK